MSKQKVRFYKYQGAGNDFIIVEDFDGAFSFTWKKKISWMCNRHYGIGADGVILLQQSRIAYVKMKIYNPDGLEAKMCGNGLRCVIKHLDIKKVTVETKEGISLGENIDGMVLATLPYYEEILSPLAIPGNREGHLINTGVSHLIIEVNNIEDDNFEAQARQYRSHHMFGPKGVNVSYICQKQEAIYIRTFERGVESETLACGTAAAAAVMVVRKYEKPKKSHYFVYPKSNQCLEFLFDSKENMWMKGPANMVFKGQVLAGNNIHPNKKIPIGKAHAK